MIGNLNLPIAKGNAKTYIFTVNGATADPTFGITGGISSTSWEKPIGINFIYVVLVTTVIDIIVEHSFVFVCTAASAVGG